MVDLFWPKMQAAKEALAGQSGRLLTDDNLEVLVARICSSGAEDTDELRMFLEDNEDENGSINNDVRSRLVDLALCLSRVKPMLDRMGDILQHDYSYAAV